MKDKIYRICPICDSSDIKNIKHVSFNMDNILPDFYFLASCNKCGFVYANTLATAADYERYYNEHNKYSSTITIDNEADSIYEVVSPILSKHINQDDAVLDMGCGTGGLLLNMKKDGYSNLNGCDPSQASTEILKTKGLNCILGSIYNAPNKTNNFDVIILSGVLEHLYDLKKAIKNTSLFLKPKSKVICFIPNVLYYNLFPAPLPYYVNIEHINHFSPNTLVLLFELCGFSLLECSSVKINFGTITAPVIIGVFENQNPNKISRENINNYLLDLEKVKSKNLSIIKNLVDSKQKIAIWGTGNLSRFFLANSNLKEAQISCFIDNNTEMVGKYFNGYIVNAPEYLKEFDGTILIFSILYHKDIVNQIQKMGIKNNVIIMEDKI